MLVSMKNRGHVLYTRQRRPNYERTRRGKYHPLDTKCLTAAHLRQVASAVGLPTKGATDQLPQVVEGKLQTDGYEARNV